MLIDYTIISIYLLFVMMIGVFSITKLNTLKDFSLSNKRYGIFCLVATLSSSFIGGGFSTGNASKVMESGIAKMIALMGFSVAMILLGKLVVPRIEHIQNASSVGDIMKNSYGRHAGICTGVFATLICSGILAAQVSAMGYLLNVFLGINLTEGIVISCVVVLVYSTLGGMCCVVMIDSIQFLVMSAGMIVLMVYSVNASGGIDEIIRLTPSTHFEIFKGESLVSFVSLSLSLALGEILAPPYIQRLLLGKNLLVTARATVISGVISVLFFTCTGVVGLAGGVYFMGSGIDSNIVMQSMIKEVVPVGIRGVIIAGTISIVMSSADSFLNTASVSFVKDVLLEISHRNHSEKQKLKMIRLVNIIIGFVAIIIAVRIPNILDVLSFSYSFWSPFVFMSLLGALLGIKSKKRAYFLSMISGGGVLLIWKYALKSPFDIEPSVVGVIINVISFWIFR